MRPLQGRGSVGTTTYVRQSVTGPSHAPRGVRTSSADVLSYRLIRRSIGQKGMKVYRTEAIEGGLTDPPQAVVIPLNFYRVLQTSEGASRDSLARAAAKLANAKSDASYSQAALDSRGVVLRAAVDFLSDPSQRRTYDRSLSLGSPQARHLNHSLPHQRHLINTCSIVS